MNNGERHGASTKARKQGILPTAHHLRAPLKGDLTTPSITILVHMVVRSVKYHQTHSKSVHCLTLNAKSVQAGITCAKASLFWRAGTVHAE
jgi:hypothetical protein